MDEPNFDAFDQKTIDTILEYGHQVIFVFPKTEEEGVAFAYTVGRALKDEPELLITGNLPPKVSGTLLNDAARLHDEGKCVLHDGYVYPRGSLMRGTTIARVIEVDVVASEMFQAVNMMGERTSALQIVWPDKHGYFPGEAGYSLPQEAQPIHPKEHTH